MDAVNVDLKAFSENFYQRQCYGSLAPVLDTLEFIARRGTPWLEVTTLLIPGLNDSDTELRRMCAWLCDHVGPDVPLHFTAFHPDFKLLDRPRTPATALLRARELALAAGMRYVYTGNVVSPETQTTRCSGCGSAVIGRDGYAITGWGLRHGNCDKCGLRLPGHFEAKPGQWGSKRRRLFIAEGA
jgi:pyruvate formate lyase activating enzyme